MVLYLHLVAGNCVQEAAGLGCGLLSCQPLQNSGNKQPGTGVTRPDTDLTEYTDLLYPTKPVNHTVFIKG